MKFCTWWVVFFVLLQMLTALLGPRIGATDLVSVISVYISKAQHALKQGNVVSARAFLGQAKKITPGDPKVLEFEREFMRTIQLKVVELRREAEFHMRNKNVPKALSYIEKS